MIDSPRTPMSLVSVTPLVPAGPSLDDALRLYVGHLGFHVTWQGPNMAGIERDGVAFNLMQSEDRHWAENSSYSIGVHGLVALYDAWKDAVPARIGALERKAWDRVEFHMVLPSGVCLQFYEAVAHDLHDH
jgi:catechol 2,3-dioxygenase-like lactoylglutathione lyase family enzyme